VVYLVISDIHANMQALEAVLADAPPFDEAWCLGDLIGYGPQPNECVGRVQELPGLALAGNHDFAALGKVDLSDFNAEARLANEWTQQELCQRARAYLEALPVRVERAGYTLVHASPREPVWEYVLDDTSARANFGHFATDVCLLGHSHVPLAYEMEGRRGRCRAAAEYVDAGAAGGYAVELAGRRLILNPGSVGQPRDGDPRASYGLLDTERGVWEVRRVAYAVEEVQQRMRAHRLPRRLVERLEYGT
jgi:diadenosine tetraphosphatase ApaH/serine/threonine PP2A family protein phosphatase